MEIGSEFQLRLSDYDTVCEDNIFSYLSDYDALYLDSGRSALRFLDRVLPPGKILVPSYICRSVADSFGCRKVEYYDIETDFSIDFSQLSNQMECAKPGILYIMNYWGNVQPKDILDSLKVYCRDHGIVIIEDTSHSILTDPNSIGDFCVCSLRKWGPVPRGGVVYSKGKLPAYPDSIKTGASEEKMAGLILKQLYMEDSSLDCNSIYRKIFRQDNERLDAQKDVYALPAFSRFILELISIGELKAKRKRNADLLNELLNKTNGIKKTVSFTEEATPFTFPVYSEQRDELREFLSKNEIYCAVHWPLEDERQRNENSRWINDRIISLNIDQRYGEKDMNRIAETILEFCGGTENISCK